MNFVSFFKDLSKSDVSLAGGKGAQLGELTRMGMPVPPGFVVTTSAFKFFVKENNLGEYIAELMEKVDVGNIDFVNSVSEEIRASIRNGVIPEDVRAEIDRAYGKLGVDYVAVRSSATAEDARTASWAGELESYLNVSPEELVSSIKNCWSSLYTPRAIVYYRERNIHQKNVSVAVVVQKMVDSAVSGVVFTEHPVTRQKNHMVIEAGFGLGEAVVGGLITPDCYVVDKDVMEVVDLTVNQQDRKFERKSGTTREVKLTQKDGSKQKLTENQILKLARMCRKIEDHYRWPQDIEWAVENGVIYVLQTRPITTI